mmetsp:Transcript_137260/g.293248  ORF Transcript_137260/g.293248 Transcript_137260/m.293248 type:complete len:206 (-) Transcript_137260:80-697(-)
MGCGQPPRRPRRKRLKRLRSKCQRSRPWRRPRSPHFAAEVRGKCGRSLARTLRMDCRRERVSGASRAPSMGMAPSLRIGGMQGELRLRDRVDQDASPRPATALTAHTLRNSRVPGAAESLMRNCYPERGAVAGAATARHRRSGRLLSKLDWHDTAAAPAAAACAAVVAVLAKPSGSHKHRSRLCQWRGPRRTSSDPRGGHRRSSP